MAFTDVPSGAATAVDLVRAGTTKYTFLDQQSNERRSIVEIRVGSSFTLPEQIEIVLRGYDWRGDQTATGVDFNGSTCTLKDPYNNTLANFSIEMVRPLFNGRSDADTFLMVNLCLNATQTASLPVTPEGQVLTADLAIAIFEQECGAAVEATPITLMFVVVPGKPNA